MYYETRQQQQQQQQQQQKSSLILWAKLDCSLNVFISQLTDIHWIGFHRYPFRRANCVLPFAGPLPASNVHGNSPLIRLLVPNCHSFARLSAVFLPLPKRNQTRTKRSAMNSEIIQLFSLCTSTSGPPPFCLALLSVVHVLTCARYV